MFTFPTHQTSSFLLPNPTRLGVLPIGSFCHTCPPTTTSCHPHSPTTTTAPPPPTHKVVTLYAGGFPRTLQSYSTSFHQTSPPHDGHHHPIVIMFVIYCPLPPSSFIFFDNYLFYNFAMDNQIGNTQTVHAEALLQLAPLGRRREYVKRYSKTLTWNAPSMKDFIKQKTPPLKKTPNA
ncbi:hypothetical protein PIB30_009661 [Stylosanthes scabra]|uniref:Uncharacterized protein n=1 Tax=Stylosanthes scabra TaxID=79078 RepID=A0ABU6T574_9FABA|nr:hypothetical protein [Stylosanthes scabra]